MQIRNLLFRSFRPVVTILVVTMTIVEGKAQKLIQSQNNAWAWYVGNHRITDRLGLHTEYAWRRNDFFDTWMQSLARFAVDYNSKPGPQYAIGYCFVDTYEYGVQPTTYRFLEHRLFEQITTNQQIGRVHTSNRLRVEHRWLENKRLNAEDVYVRAQDDPFIFRNRIRYRFILNLPLSRSTLSDHTLFLSLADEVFLNTGREIRLNAFDQNRITANLGWRIDSNRNLQVGYLNQYILKSDAKKAERNHTLQIGITWGLDLRKTDPPGPGR